MRIADLNEISPVYFIFRFSPQNVQQVSDVTVLELAHLLGSGNMSLQLGPLL